VIPFSSVIGGHGEPMPGRYYGSLILATALAALAAGGYLIGAALSLAGTLLLIASSRFFSRETNDATATMTGKGPSSSRPD
jgi:hypothetical protein